MFHRLAGCWTYWGWKGGYFRPRRRTPARSTTSCAHAGDADGAPNTPQWFNTGLHWAYGIEGPRAGPLFRRSDTGKLTKSKSAYEHPQPHACFIQSINDDLVNDGGIMDLWVREARIFKYGSGTGSNFSELRGEGEPLSGGGKSSGLMSFLKIGDRAAGAIKSGGTTRRAAKMVVLDLDHPDIEEFVNWKVTEEQKVAALVTGSKLIEPAPQRDPEGLRQLRRPERDDRFDPSKNPASKRASTPRAALVPDNYIERVIQLAKQGFTALEVEEYDTDWNSKAYYTVSGQNRTTRCASPNEFMKAVETDGEWHLYWRTD